MKYYHVKKRYLAEALSYLGFHYYKFNNANVNTKKVYSFEDTNNFRNALNDLVDLKDKYDNYK